MTDIIKINPHRNKTVRHINPVSRKKKRRDEPKPPSESVEQKMLMQWAALLEKAHPELRLLHAIPNGGARDVRTGARMKDEGVKRGVPDLCLPVPRGGYHGLYIELKRQSGGRITPEQREWLYDLGKQGYKTMVCNGWQDAAEVITEYLRGVREGSGTE